MKNQGISLISLIITIIVIIILAAIVIFSGMDTPERAQLSNFAQQVSNVHSAVIDQLTGVTTEFTAEGKTRNTEQIYYKLATNEDCGQYGFMQGDALKKSTDTFTEAEGIGCQNISVTAAKDLLNLKLPTVREHAEAWYVTKDGQVFNATGFVTGDKTYFTADLYTDKPLDVAAGTAVTYENRAQVIAEAIAAGETGKISKEVPNENGQASVTAPNENGQASGESGN